MAEDWQSQKFRQNVINKINEMLQNTGQMGNKNAGTMESHIFKKSRNKDEYLSLVAKLFMHFRDSANRKPSTQQQQQQQQNEMGQQPNMNTLQDPLNALQNLASQGNRPQMMAMQGGGPNQMGGPGGPVAASNLLQTLNQQRPGQIPQQMQGIRGQMPIGSGSQGPSIVGPGPGQQQQMVPQMGPGGIQMNVMSGAGAGGPGGSGPQQQLVGGNAAQHMSGSGIPGQMNVVGGPNAGGGPGSSGLGGPNQIQMNAAQVQGGNGPSGPINVNAINVQQMQQMQQNQMAMGIHHPQLNQMMNARMNQAAVGGIPPNMQQNQSGGPIHPTNVSVASSVAGSAPPQMSGAGGLQQNAGQAANLNQILQMSNLQQQQQQQQQKPPNVPTLSQAGQQIFPVNRGLPGQQFMRQCPSPSTTAPPNMSPAQQQLQQQQQQQQQQQLQQQQQQQLQQQQQQQPQQQQQQINGPSPQQQQSVQQIPQVPTPQMIPSPALVPTPSPQMPGMMQNNQRNLRQSPSAPLNTPGQVASNSPFNPHEDQLYREKYKQLTKYIDPLKRMVAKIGTNDGTNAEKMTKMSKLLEILCNPSQRVPLETLLKCEKALEKMEIVVFSGQQFPKSQNPLMDVLNTTLLSPIANHTLHRTFRPSLDLLFGTDICAPTQPKRRRQVEKTTQFELEIPHILQGEIARLDQKFKVTLDPGELSNKKLIRLICCLDDKHLPAVPSISCSIPEDYPFVPPECWISRNEYSGTPFLIMVQNALLERITKLPKCYSLSQLLDTWEMAVRQACSPNAKPTQVIYDLADAFAI